MKERFTEFPLRIFLRVFVPAAASLAAACSEDPTGEFAPKGRALRFDVVQDDGWNTPQSRAASGDEMSGITQVLKLQGETPADTLFLHVTVSDGIEPNAAAENAEAETRADLVEDMSQYGAFEVFGFAYTGAWESSLPANLMNRVKVVEQGNGIWAPASTTYHWPGANKKARFFAVAPENMYNISKNGVFVNEGRFNYDILFADSEEMAGDTDAPIPLTFKHIMSCLKFIAGDDMMAGRIIALDITNVPTRHQFVWDTATWSVADDEYISYYRLAINLEIDGTAETELCHYFLLQQRLPEQAKLEIRFRDALTSKERRLTASVGGLELPMGKTVTFRLSTSSITVEPHLQIGWMNDFPYAGGTHQYSVSSYIEVNGGYNGVPDRVATPWTAEFSTDGGQTWTREKPEWLTAFTSEGAGGYASTNYAATVAAQQAVTANPHNDMLQAATPVVGTYDLSTKGGTTAMNTANCYIINAPGRYSLPLVYGNAIKNGATNSSAYISNATGTGILKNFINHTGKAITDPYIYNNADCVPDNATLVWQDEKDLVTNIALAEDGKSLTFEVGASTIKQGNAVVAVHDTAGKIMWSWHIWVTDYVPELPATTETDDGRDKVIANDQNVQYTMMPINIGWCYTTDTIYEGRTVKVRFVHAEATNQAISVERTISQSEYIDMFGNNPYYQMGRKDPILPIEDNNNSVQTKKWYNANGDESTSLTVGALGWYNTCVVNCILNPDKMNTNYDMENLYRNLWSADNTILGIANDDLVVKTIYDPSPVGYKVPASNVFTFTKADSSSSPSVSGSFNKGWYFYCDDNQTGPAIFFPASGCRRYYALNAFNSFKSQGCYWTAIPYSLRFGWSLYFTSQSVDPLNAGNNRSDAYSVRSVREQ